MFAIISDRGRQYRVQEGDLLRVDRLPLEKGAMVSFDTVLLLGRQDKVEVGAPRVPGARVTGLLEEQVKGPKLIALRRTTSNAHVVRRGHRNQYSLVRIQKIEV
jgi:large subunit ribosomal protein L21